MLRGCWSLPTKFPFRSRLRPTRAEFSIDICDCPIERDELWIVDLGNIDAKPMVNSDNEVEEVDGVDVDGFAQVSVRVDVRQIGFRRDVIEFLLHYFANFGAV